MNRVDKAAVVECTKLTVREINREIRRLIADGTTEIDVRNPAARHNLGVALEHEVTIRLDGPAGWYAGGMNDGAHLVVDGNCGWGVAECMMRGSVRIRGHAGSGTAASIRGGLVHVAGDAGARAGIAMKGGTLVVGGDVGYMSGFMMQRGTMVICGDAADGLGDSLYEGVIYIAGTISSLGADAVEAPMTDEDVLALGAALASVDCDLAAGGFRKVESGRALWNFSAKDSERWRAAQ